MRSKNQKGGEEEVVRNSCGNLQKRLSWRQLKRDTKGEGKTTRILCYYWCFPRLDVYRAVIKKVVDDAAAELKTTQRAGDKVVAVNYVNTSDVTLYSKVDGVVQEDRVNGTAWVALHVIFSDLLCFIFRTLPHQYYTLQTKQGALTKGVCAADYNDVADMNAAFEACEKWRRRRGRPIGDNSVADLDDVW